MKQDWLENIIAGSYAVALHIVIVVLLFIGFESDSTTIVEPAQVDIVQATMVDEQQVLDDIAERKERVDEIKAEEAARQAAIEKKAAEEKAALEREIQEREQEKIRVEQEKQRQVELELEREKAEQRQREEAEQKKVEAEKQRIADEKQKLEAEKQRVEQEKQKAEAEKQRLAEEKKKAEEQKRKAEEAAKLKAEKEREAAEEKKRQAAAEQKRLADAEKRKKEEADRLLQDSLAAEEREREDRRIAGVVNQHMGMIRQRIKRYWSEPANATQGMQCTLRVSLLPDGDVKNVSIVKSSGNAIFDRSAESAVYKAAPWPQPSDPKAAAALRDFQFIFRPK